MASERPSLLPEIGLDGIAREASVITYTEKVIEAEQIQLKKYIQENYSKIRDVERELENLTLELKLTAGPKKAALEHMRKKIELSTEKIRIARLKEDQARKVWEEAAKLVKDEEAIKQKLCDDLNQLVQESSSTQFTRLEELKRRLEALNPARASCDISVTDGKLLREAQGSTTSTNSIAPQQTTPAQQTADSSSNHRNTSDASTANGQPQVPTDGDGRGKKKMLNLGRGKGNMNMSKGRGSSNTGWNGAGFDVDGRS